MGREFTYSKKSGGPSKPVGFSRVMTVAANRVVIGDGPFRLQKNDEDEGPRRDRGELLNQLRRRVLAGDTGDVFKVDNKDEKLVIKIREIKPAIEVIDTNGNDKADACWSAVVAEFPNVSFLGAYVCKAIAHTGTKSQHSFGNGLDIGAGSMDILNAIATWLVARYDTLSLEHVIVGNRVWTRGQGWHTYTGDFHYHVHCDFYSNFSPYLSCGVRN